MPSPTTNVRVLLLDRPITTAPRSGRAMATGGMGDAGFTESERTRLMRCDFADFWGPVSNFGIPIAAVMDTQKSPEL